MDRFERRAGEWWYPALVAIVWVAVGTFPYLYASSFEDEHLRFMGRIDRGPQNANVYAMFARQAAEGRFFFENRMTADPLPRAYVNLEWWLVGSVSRWLGLPRDAAFHLERVASLFLIAFAAYALCAVTLRTVAGRRLATALICFGSGLGWLVWLHARLADVPMTLVTYTMRGSTMPLPLDITGINVFYQGISRPHAARLLAAAMLFGACLIRGEQTGRLRWFVLAGLALNARATIRPYELPESFLLLGCFPLVLMLREGRFSWRRCLPYALTLLVAAPTIAQNLYLVFAKPLGFNEFSVPPLPVLTVVLWQGLPLMAALLWFTGFRHLRWMPASTIFLTLWLVIPLALAYSYPYYPDGCEGLGVLNFVPVVLAVQGPYAALYRWMERRLSGAPRLRNHRRLMLSAAVAFLVAFSAISTVLATFRVCHTVAQREIRWFLPRDLYAAMQWLEKEAPPSSTVLALPETGNWVPALSSSKTVAANWMFTPDFEAKAQAAHRFFHRAGDETFKRTLVLGQGVDYVLFGPREADVAREGGFDPRRYAWLVPVFRAGNTTVFEVQEPRGRATVSPPPTSG